MQLSYQKYISRPPKMWGLGLGRQNPRDKFADVCHRAIYLISTLYQTSIFDLSQHCKLLKMISVHRCYYLNQFILCFIDPKYIY